MLTVDTYLYAFSEMGVFDLPILIFLLPIMCSEIKKKTRKEIGYLHFKCNHFLNVFYHLRTWKRWRNVSF